MQQMSSMSAPAASSDGVPFTLGGADQYVAAWVAQQLDISLEDWGPCSACGVVLDGQLIAGVVYNEYRELRHGRTMCASIASISPRWATRKTLRDLFAYPFRQIEVRRLWSTTARRNKNARTVLERLGFKFEGIARRSHDGRQDAAVYGMLPHECRWL